VGWGVGGVGSGREIGLGWLVGGFCAREVEATPTVEMSILYSSTVLVLVRSRSKQPFTRVRVTKHVPGYANCHEAH